MATTTKPIGKLPVFKGAYSSTTTYGKLNQVSYLGSTYQSTVDNNTTAPASTDANGGIVDDTTGKWAVIARGQSFSQSLGSSTTIGVSQKTITDELNSLKNEVFPLTITFTGGGVYEQGTTAAVSLAWTVKHKGATVTPTTQQINGYSATSPATYSPTSDTTYTLAVTYNGQTASATRSAKFVYASYCGVCAGMQSLEASGIKALTKYVKDTKALTATLTLANQCVCYAYPKIFGALTSIKDANNFEYVNSYNRQEQTIDGEAYYVYYLASPVTITNFKQIFA